MPATAPKKWIHRGLIALVILALGAALSWWLGRPKPVAVLVAPVGRGVVEATVANTRAGTVEACQRTRLSTISGGRIEVLAVKEGDRVKKGQFYRLGQRTVNRMKKRRPIEAADACKRRTAAHGRLSPDTVAPQFSGQLPFVDANIRPGVCLTMPVGNVKVALGWPAPGH